MNYYQERMKVKHDIENKFEEMKSLLELTRVPEQRNKIINRYDKIIKRLKRKFKDIEKMELAESNKSIKECNVARLEEIRIQSNLWRDAAKARKRRVFYGN